MAVGQDESQEKDVTTDGDKGKGEGFFSFESIRSFAVLILVVFAIRSSIASPYHVPTASMEPTIKVGDRLLAWKLAYNLKVPFTDIVLWEWARPKKGDIIVFKFPRNPDKDYVKRVVGEAGDRIQLIDDVLHVNGEPQPRTEHDHDRTILEDITDTPEVKTLFRETLSGKEHWVMQNIPTVRHFTRANWPASGEPHVVAPDSVFVMGDNRDNSTDSRMWFEVPIAFVRGKAMFVIWSLYFKPDSNIPRFRLGRIGSMLQ